MADIAGYSVLVLLAVHPGTVVAAVAVVAGLPKLGMAGGYLEFGYKITIVFNIVLFYCSFT